MNRTEKPEVLKLLWPSIVFLTWLACAAHARAAPPLNTQRELNRFHVVLDPGHGGSDHGASYRENGKLIEEKTLTLALAREAAKQLRDRGIEVSLTRSTDVEVPLAVRTAFANRLGAQLFISLHMNSSQGQLSKAEGVETYILNTTTDASSRRLARLENSVIGNQLEAVESDQTDVALILKDLQLDGNLAESKRLACLLQTELVGDTTRLYPKLARQPLKARDRGVKQALFHVLLGADMPSALIEAGFMTSARDRKLILSRDGRVTMAKAIADAVDAYRRNRGPAVARFQPSRATAMLCQ